jgi:hypothetical protein
MLSSSGLFEPFCRFFGEVRNDDVRACTLDGSQGFQRYDRFSSNQSLSALRP